MPIVKDGLICVAMLYCIHYGPGRVGMLSTGIPSLGSESIHPGESSCRDSGRAGMPKGRKVPRGPSYGQKNFSKRVTVTIWPGCIDIHDLSPHLESWPILKSNIRAEMEGLGPWATAPVLPHVASRISPCVELHRSRATWLRLARPARSTRVSQKETAVPILRVFEPGKRVHIEIPKDRAMANVEKKIHIYTTALHFLPCRCNFTGGYFLHKFGAARLSGESGYNTAHTF